MKKIYIILIIGILLVGTFFVTAKIFDYEKIKDVDEIDCNKKVNPDKCKDEKKIKIPDDTIKVELVREVTTGQEFYRITAE